MVVGLRLVGVDPGKAVVLCLFETPVFIDYMVMPYQDKLVDGQELLEMLMF